MQRFEGDGGPSTADQGRRNPGCTEDVQAVYRQVQVTIFLVFTSEIVCASVKKSSLICVC
jgi:hypothetical protein